MGTEVNYYASLTDEEKHEWNEGEKHLCDVELPAGIRCVIR
jgi:hypothetical protein